MKITTKGFYAVEIMRALAAWEKGLPMSLADVEEKTGVPRSYVGLLALRLKRAGLAKSFRGNAGGYRIAKKAKDISLTDIFAASGEDVAPWPGKAQKRFRRPLMCPAHPVWQKLYRQTADFFKRTTLADFL